MADAPSPEVTGEGFPPLSGVSQEGVTEEAVGRDQAATTSEALTASHETRESWKELKDRDEPT